MATAYTAESIRVLEGLEAVRKRPGMYIGSTGSRGLHHLVAEVVDNSVDEALAGECDRIDIVLLANGGVRVSDNGRGIPVDEHPLEHRSALEVVMTTLHAGGKFYAVSGGLHGVGVSVVNALSSRLETEVVRDGYRWRQSYIRGIPTGPVERVQRAKGSGTTQIFWPDPDIFEELDFRYEILSKRMRERRSSTRGSPSPSPTSVPTPRSRTSTTTTAASAILSPTSTPARSRSTPRSSTSRGSPTPRRSRWRCSGTRATTTRSRPSPTPSTPTRAGPTKRASARR